MIVRGSVIPNRRSPVGDLARARELLGSLARFVRILLHLGLQDIAEAAGVSVSMLSIFERGAYVRNSVARRIVRTLVAAATRAEDEDRVLSEADLNELGLTELGWIIEVARGRQELLRMVKDVHAAPAKTKREPAGKRRPGAQRNVAEAA